MLKYDHQLTDVKTRLPSVNRILIVLPSNLNVDRLAAGLSLYLSLKATGKKIDIVSAGTPQVSQSHLFGLGEIKNDVSKIGGGNFVISLDGVVDTTGTMQQVPALEKLDWYPEGSKLNLVFHVVKGQRFEPTNITSKHEESGYDLTIVIGCQSLNELGDIFISNSQYFAQSQVVNIDTNPLNSYFGFANVIDPQASSLSEIVAHILPSLTLSMDLDVSSNIIAGIYFATNNLTTNVNPETFSAVSQAVQVGGSLPNIQPQTSQPEVKIDFQTEPNIQPPQQVEPAPIKSGPAPIKSEPAPVQPASDLMGSVPAEQIANSPIPTPTPEPVNSSFQSSPFIVPPQDITIPIPQAQTPIASEPQIQPQLKSSQPFLQTSDTVVQADSAPVQPASTPIQTESVIPQANNQGFDLRQIFQIPQMPASAIPANPEPQVFGAVIPTQTQVSTPMQPGSPEERPMGEFASSPSPEIESTPTPDWLVPKIFKGGNLG